jgi:tRNA(Ile)-lysidine synthase
VIEADFDGIDAPVVVACSGGPDSLALLILAVDVGLDPIAVQVDHGLRAGSELDATAVATMAERLGAGFAAVRIDVAPGGNLEARARAARYRALEETRGRAGATAVLVAHTADDQAETVLLNLLRGSGLAGLSGMAARRGAVARPLLGVRRAELAELVRERGFEALRDPTNDDLAYKRNWVRHEVLPLLERGAARDLVPVLARQADVMRADAELLDDLADVVLERACTDPGERALDVRVLIDAHPALARRALRRWLGEPPPSGAEVERVLDLVHGSARAAELAGSRRVWRSEGVLHQALGSTP